ncbi:MAG: TlpA family protein disulfide reductase, partial [Desulfotomaculales bacterium]
GSGDTEPQKISSEASFKAGLGRYLGVTTPEGKEALLDLEKKPALFFAVWCPHCDEALKEAAKFGPEKRPYLVVTYLREGDAEKAREKLAENGLVGEEYYFAGSLPADIQGVPALVWMVGGKFEYVKGAGAITEKLHG